MELAEKSQDLRFTNWRPKRGNGMVLVQRPARSGSRKSRYSVQVQTQKQNYVLAQGNQTLLLRGGSAFLFCSDPN